MFWLDIIIISLFFLASFFFAYPRTLKDAQVHATTNARKQKKWPPAEQLAKQYGAAGRRRRHAVRVQKGDHRKDVQSSQEEGDAPCASVLRLQRPLRGVEHVGAADQDR